MRTLLEVFFLPPMAVARLGSAKTPLESYRWAHDESAHGGNMTVIEPAVTLRVGEDASLSAYLPRSIRFKEDDGSIRPVAPFFELWARMMRSEDGGEEEVPVTLDLLHELGISPGDFQFTVTSANRKAARRTSYAPCGFAARVRARGDDHSPKALLAVSPHTSGQQPLVPADKPIPLGTFQVLRPTRSATELGGEHVDLSVLRVRFTPPEGKVYGPPTATSAPASPVPPGQYDAFASEYGNIHEIVAPENRFLNPNTPWSTYVMMTGEYQDPQPQDGYDGANVGNSQSWGVVDDTSDSVLEVELALRGQLFSAHARVFTGPPDFAPDRRPIYSLADDLADRELPPVPVTEETLDETTDEIVDLFERAFETASLLNLDASRTRALNENAVRKGMRPAVADRDAPKTGVESLTAHDTPYVDKAPSLLIPQAPSAYSRSVTHDKLPYTEVVTHVHAQLTERLVLLDFIARRAEHVRRLIRPPFGAFRELAENPGPEPSPTHRDPRVFRDGLHDMRMPPYMRDANLYPLSISRRWYRELMAFVDLVSARRGRGGE